MLLLILLAATAVWIAQTGQMSSLRPQWIFVVAVLVALCILAGYLVNGRLDGVMIDDRNRISLERVQWVSWFIVLLGGYFTEAVWNAAYGSEFPGMETELLALLGIVSASLVLSNLILEPKKQVPPGKPAAGQVAPQAPPLAANDHPIQIGSLDANSTVDDASWADLYLGEEAANRYIVDVSRLQKLVITVLLVVTYVGWLWRDFGMAPAKGFEQMPKIGDTFVWLLGISHGAYLAFKATPKTPA